MPIIVTAATRRTAMNDLSKLMEQIGPARGPRSSLDRLQKLMTNLKGLTAHRIVMREILVVTTGVTRAASIATREVVSRFRMTTSTRRRTTTTAAWITC